MSAPTFETPENTETSDKIVLEMVAGTSLIEYSSRNDMRFILIFMILILILIFLGFIALLLGVIASKYS